MVVAGSWVMGLVAGGALWWWWWWWWWDGVFGLNEPNVGSGLGDMDHHVIQVGTCCSNWHDFTWAGGSAVKCALL